MRSLPSCRSDRFGGGGEPLFAARAQNHGGSPVDQQLGGCPPDAAACSGDRDDPAFDAYPSFILRRVKRLARSSDVARIVAESLAHQTLRLTLARSLEERAQLGDEAVAAQAVGSQPVG